MRPILTTLCLILASCEAPTLGGAGQLIGGLIAYPVNVAKSVHEAGKTKGRVERLQALKQEGGDSL
ncbi:MAG: hypothetical protein JWO08_2354 [Verrucomicrobiaceae bacterium]|nr:hypothetical protein [Verrucomicrobiaceae bacterium]